ncbi:MAG: hypothetical protein QG614_581 [Patescibacteria group bacterium]|nr:hypothetical protein [Patescibacteria group bacterium]
MVKNGCPFEKGLDERKLKYSYSYHASEITFISQFLDDMTHKVKKLKLAGSKLEASDLLDIITEHIVDKFYHIELEEVEDLYVSQKEYEDGYYPCITYMVKLSIRKKVRDLYSNFMEYMDLIEEEDKKPEYSEGFKHVENRGCQDLLEVFFVRDS